MTISKLRTLYSLNKVTVWKDNTVGGYELLYYGSVYGLSYGYNKLYILNYNHVYNNGRIVETEILVTE